MARCARLFEKNGVGVCSLALTGAPHPVSDLSALAGADATVLPLPITKNGGAPTGEGTPTFDEIFRALGTGALVLGGAVPPSLFDAADRVGVRLVDYYLDEELLRENARLTAEAAVGMAMLNLPVSLRGARTAVVGSGRIARALCRILLALGARVDIYARNPVSLAVLASHGGEPHLFDGERPLVIDGRTDAVFSTVPEKILGGAALARLAPKTPLYDLGGGGVCRESAEKGGLPLPDCAALPGRYSPNSAADAIYAALLRVIAREGVK